MSTTIYKIANIKAEKVYQGFLRTLKEKMHV